MCIVNVLAQAYVCALNVIIDTVRVLINYFGDEVNM